MFIPVTRESRIQAILFNIVTACIYVLYAVHAMTRYDAIYAEEAYQHSINQPIRDQYTLQIFLLSSTIILFFVWFFIAVLTVLVGFYNSWQIARGVIMLLWHLRDDLARVVFLSLFIIFMGWVLDALAFYIIGGIVIPLGAVAMLCVHCSMWK